MTVYAVQTFNISQNARQYEFVVNIPPGERRTALLFVHIVRASANEEAFGLQVAGWMPVGEPATTTTTNRRYLAGAFALAEPAAGPLRVVVEAGRPVNGLVAFLYLADNLLPVGSVAAVGEAGSVNVPGPFRGPVVIGAMARPGARIEPDAGEVVARGETKETDATTRVTAALVAAADVDAVVLSGRALLALAVALEQPPLPPPKAHELSVIVRDLAEGATHEVRWVRPGEVVMGSAGIDWEQTPHQAHIFTGETG
jgi:nitrate reductase NapE component